MSDFSLKLSDDQIGLQSWVHGFAEDVVRPAQKSGMRRKNFLTQSFNRLLRSVYMAGSSWQK